MRFIDADALIDAMTKFSNAIGEDMTHGIFYAHIAPTIDAVPVIRCMDCKYWSTETEQTAVPNMHKCTWWRTIGTLPIDFCSRAERRGEE